MAVPMQAVPDPPSEQNFRELAKQFPVRDLADDVVGANQLADGAKELFPQLPTAALRVLVAGQVSSAGAVALGAGFTAEKSATGKYTVKLTNALASNGVIVCSPISSISIPTPVTASSKQEFKVEIYNTSSVAVDAAFNFFILG